VKRSFSPLEALIEVVGFAILLACLLAPRVQAQSRFAIYDLFIDPQAEPLAAYQVKIKASSGHVKIISVEGGEHPAFKAAPYFVPTAIQKETIKLAAFSTVTAKELPEQQTRVASIHIQFDESEAVKFDLKLQAAATVNGRPIEPRLRLVERAQE